MNLRSGRKMPSLKRPLVSEDSKQESKKRRVESEIKLLDQVQKIEACVMTNDESIGEEEEVDSLFFELGKKYSRNGLYDFPDIIQNITSYLGEKVSLFVSLNTSEGNPLLFVPLHIYFLFL